MPMRPSFSVSMAILYPLPTSPTTRSLGILQLSSSSSQVLDALMPSLLSRLPTEKPGSVFSTRKAVMPL